LIVRVVDNPSGKGSSVSSPLMSTLSARKETRHEARGLASPDLGDTLAMTFAINVNQRLRERKDA